MVDDKNTTGDLAPGVGGGVVNDAGDREVKPAVVVTRPGIGIEEAQRAAAAALEAQRVRAESGNLVSLSHGGPCHGRGGEGPHPGPPRGVPSLVPGHPGHHGAEGRDGGYRPTGKARGPAQPRFLGRTSGLVDLAAFREARSSAAFMRGLLHEPLWLSEVAVEADELGAPRIVVLLHWEHPEIRQVLPTAVNHVPVLVRVA